MRDFKYNIEALDQRASGTIEVDDYTLLVGVAATGTLTVVNYANLVGAQATGTIDVDDYTKLIEAAATGTIDVDDYTLFNENAATGTITITDYTQLNGVTFTVNGNDYVEGVNFQAETSNDVTATNLAAALDAADDIGAGAVAAVVTITADTAGTAGNSIDTSTDAGAGVTLSGANLTGGRDYATVTVDGDTYTAGTDFTAETNDDTTATNLAAAIDAGSNVGAAAITSQVTITATAAGTAGNALAMSAVYAAGAMTLSGATLSGGQAHATITIGSDTITQGTDFTAETNNDTTATNIASAIDALSGVGAAAITNQVTVTNTAVGVAGNSKALTAVYAAGGLTLSDSTLLGGIDHGTVTIGSDTLTQGTDFNAVTNNDTTATNIAAAIDALANVGAAAVGAVVTVTYDSLGTAGNSVSMATNKSSDITLSGATLAGGVAPCTVTVGTDTLTEQTDFNAATDEDTTATNLAAAIDALSDYTASATGAIVTVYNTAPGTAGNSKALTSNKDGAGVTLSAATLLGGVAQTYSDTFDFDTDDDVQNVEAILDIDTLTGTLPTVNVTPQYSNDKDDWHDHDIVFTEVTAAVSSETIDSQLTGLYWRFKIVLGGSDPVVSGKVTAIAK